jgi:hypothetical protein
MEEGGSPKSLRPARNKNQTDGQEKCKGRSLDRKEGEAPLTPPEAQSGHNRKGRDLLQVAGWKASPQQSAALTAKLIVLSKHV